MSFSESFRIFTPGDLDYADVAPATLDTGMTSATFLYWSLRFPHSKKFTLNSFHLSQDLIISKLRKKWPRNNLNSRNKFITLENIVLNPSYSDVTAIPHSFAVPCLVQIGFYHFVSFYWAFLQKQIRNLFRAKLNIE